MSEQFYGSFSRLIPPLTVGGVEYGAVLRWTGEPGRVDAPDGAGPTGLVELVETVSGSRKRVVIQREIDFDSYTKVVGAGNSWEEVFPVLRGGGFCPTMEPQRLYSAFSSQAYRGADAGRKAMVGDMLWWNGRGFPILATKAYGYQHGSVTWQGDVNRSRTYRRECGAAPDEGGEPTMGLQLDWPDATGENAGARILWDPDGGVFEDCGLYETGTTTPLTRKVFERPADSVEDPNYYPTDAAFTGYWYEPGSFAIRIGSGGSPPANLTAVYYHSGLVVLADAVDVVVIGAEGAGYDGEQDEQLGIVAQVTRGDFVAVFRVYDAAANGYGNGAVEWRVELAEGTGGVVALEWTDGTLTHLRVRDGTGATIGDASLTPNGTPFAGAFFSIRMTKTGGSFLLEWANPGGGWSTAGSASLTDVVEKTSGLLSVAAWGGNKIKVQGWNGAGTAQAVGASMWRQEVKSWTGVALTEAKELPGSTALSSVKLSTRDAEGVEQLVVMTQSTTPRRDHYGLSGTTLTLYGETAGDTVVITHAAAAGSPATPGRAPRMGGTVGMADGGADPAVNQANNSDYVEIDDPNGEFMAAPNDEVQARRDAGPRALTAQYATKGEGGLDYTALDGAVCLHRLAEKFTLLRQDWLEGFDPGTLICWRGVGEAPSQAGNMKARMANDLGLSLESFDQLWTFLEVGSPADGISGEGQGRGMVPTGFVCAHGGTLVDWAGAMIGRSRESCFADVQILRSVGAAYPYWHRGDDGKTQWVSIFGSDVMEFTDADYNVQHDCQPGGPSWNEKDIGTDGMVVTVFPFSYDAIGGNYCGTSPVMLGDGAITVGGPVFNFQGVGVSPRGMAKRLPSGAQCVEAWALVKFEGLEICEYSGSIRTVGIMGLPANEILNEYSLNGVPTERYHTVGGVLQGDSFDDSGTVPMFVDGGTVGLQLIGKRGDSRNIYCPIVGYPAYPLGLTVQEPAGTWKSFGGGIALGGSVVSGKWCRVRVDNLVAALLAARASEYRDFQLWPSRAGVTPGSGPEGMASYCESLYPTQTVAFSAYDDGGGNRWHDITTTVAGQYCRWTSFECAGIVWRPRSGKDPGDGSVPLISPAAMPEP